jgi:F-type H+-transporting ATPase subunit b
MELMTPHGGTIFWTAVTFICLVLILSKFAWRPILQTLEEREKRIRESLDAAEKARVASQKTLEEQSQIIDAARREAQEILARTRKAADTAREEMLKKAGSEAEHLVEKARREIELSRDRAIEEIRGLAVELSMSATRRLIGKSLDPKDHEALIEQSLKNIGGAN